MYMHDTIQMCVEKKDIIIYLKCTNFREYLILRLKKSCFAGIYFREWAVIIFFFKVSQEIKHKFLTLLTLFCIYFKEKVLLLWYLFLRMTFWKNIWGYLFREILRNIFHFSFFVKMYFGKQINSTLHFFHLPQIFTFKSFLPSDMNCTNRVAYVTYCTS